LLRERCGRARAKPAPAASLWTGLHRAGVTDDDVGRSLQARPTLAWRLRYDDATGVWLHNWHRVLIAKAVVCRRESRHTPGRRQRNLDGPARVPPRPAHGQGSTPVASCSHGRPRVTAASCREQQESA